MYLKMSSSDGRWQYRWLIGDVKWRHKLLVMAAQFKKPQRRAKISIITLGLCLSILLTLSSRGGSWTVEHIIAGVVSGLLIGILWLIAAGLVVGICIALYQARLLLSGQLVDIYRGPGWPELGAALRPLTEMSGRSLTEFLSDRPEYKGPIDLLLSDEDFKKLCSDARDCDIRRDEATLSAIRQAAREQLAELIALLAPMEQATVARENEAAAALREAARIRQSADEQAADEARRAKVEAARQHADAVIKHSTVPTDTVSTGDGNAA